MHTHFMYWSGKGLHPLPVTLRVVINSYIPKIQKCSMCIYYTTQTMAGARKELYGTSRNSETNNERTHARVGIIKTHIDFDSRFYSIGKTHILCATVCDQ